MNRYPPQRFQLTRARVFSNYFTTGSPHKIRRIFLYQHMLIQLFCLLVLWFKQFYVTATNTHFTSNIYDNLLAKQDDKQLGTPQWHPCSALKYSDNVTTVLQPYLVRKAAQKTNHKNLKKINNYISKTQTKVHPIERHHTHGRYWQTLPTFRRYTLPCRLSPSRSTSRRLLPCPCPTTPLCTPMGYCETNNLLHNQNCNIG